MDGTLLQSDGILSEYTKQKINEFYDKGIPFSIATARSMVSAKPLLEGVRFCAPVVLMNGVFVYDLEKEKAISYHEIPHSALKNILDIFYENKLHPCMFLYGDDGLLSIKFTELDNEVMEWFYNARVNMLDGRFTKTDDMTKIPQGQHPVYINHFAPKELLDPIAEKMKSVEGISFAYYKDSYSDDWLIEIYSATASKAQGAKELCEYLHGDSITAFGDNLNDLIMLKGADRAVAVENAVDQVKKIAHIVIGTNDEDSVVKFIDNENK
jgi:Cof subfamily protein (haloacid dehalogenase superfamily)